MRRLALAPLVVGGLAAGAAIWYAGLAWPLITQAWSVLAPRPEGEGYEPDVVA